MGAVPALGGDVLLVPGLRRPRLVWGTVMVGAVLEGNEPTESAAAVEVSSTALPRTRAWRRACPLTPGCPLRPGFELRRGAGFQADGAKGSLDKPELPVANWDGIPVKYPALPAALAGLPLDLHGRRGGEGGTSKALSCPEQEWPRGQRGQGLRQATECPGSRQRSRQGQGEEPLFAQL